MATAPAGKDEVAELSEAALDALIEMLRKGGFTVQLLDEQGRSFQREASMTAKPAEDSAADERRPTRRRREDRKLH